jgi:predicted alpha/beta superfamily hydrolase
MNTFAARASSHDPSLLIPSTQFFEVTSAIAGVTYGVWVSTPPGYDPAGAQHYPAIFAPDGNLFAPVTIPYLPLLCKSILTGDVMHPIRPYLQVTIGYVGAEALDPTTRFRDLLPPGEPVPSHFAELFAAWVADGTWPPEVAERSMAKISNGRADAFFRFLTDELYPWVCAHWRVDPATTSFFGDSYGGLFALWMALQRPAQFPIIGAASPGLGTPESTVFDLLEQAYACDADHSGRRLHMSVAEREISVPSYFQMGVAEPYVRLLAKLGRRPLKGLTLTTHTVPFETHMTSVPGNFFSFLRACHSAA